jgi:hypothetical protein
MGTAVDTLDLDLAIYQDWCKGAKKLDLAQKYGRNRNAITDAIERAKQAMPPVDRGQILDQSLAILDAGLAVFVPMMLDGDKAAGRLVDRLLGRRGTYLGLDSPAKLELYQSQQEIKHEPIDVRTELAALLTRIRNGDGHA